MARRKKPQDEEEQEEEMLPVVPAGPITEPVEVDLGDEEIAAVAPDTGQANGGAVPSVPAQEPQEAVPQPEPQQDDLRKRLADMEAAQQRYQEDLRRANEQAQNERKLRQEAEALASRSRQDAAQDRYDSLVNAIGSAQEQIDSAKRDLRTYGAEGNWEAIAEAQEKIGRLSAQLQTLESAKNQVDVDRERPPQQQQQPQQPQQQQADPVEATIANLPDRAKTWLRGHREYLTDARKNAALQHAHWQAVDELKSETMDDRYFDTMEMKLGLRQPAPAPSPAPSNGAASPPIQVSAPPTREVPSMATGQSTPRRVTLNAEEREVASAIAASRNITQQEAEREYAKQKIRLQQLKADGHYNQR